MSRGRPSARKRKGETGLSLFWTQTVGCASWGMSTRNHRSARSYHAVRYAEFRARLLEARRLSGLTQREVALRLKRTQSFVAKCETGERRVDVVELSAFAELYSQPLSFFVEGDAKVVDD